MRDAIPSARSVLAAFQSYQDVPVLASLELAQGSLVTRCLLEGDAGMYPDARGWALRATLDWALENLRIHHQKWVNQSYEVLHARYIEGVSNTEYANRTSLTDNAAQKRRQKAVERVTELLQQELESVIGLVDRKQRMLRLRYDNCSGEQKLMLHFLGVFRGVVDIDTIFTWGENSAQYSLDHLLAINLLVHGRVFTEVRVHPEVRPYLLKLILPGERKEWERAAAAFHQQRGDVLEAVYHWQMAGCAEAAAALLIAQRREVGHENLPLESLRERLAAFRWSDLSLDTRAQLNLLTGRAEELAGHLEAALRAYREALAAVENSVKAEAYYRLGRVYRQTDLDAALAHFGHGKRLLADTTHPDEYELLARVCISEAWIFIDHRPDAAAIEQNLTLAEKALPHCAEKERTILLSDLYNARAAALHTFRRQQVAPYQQNYIAYRWQAWRYAQEARDLVRMMNTGHNLGMAYMRQGQYAAARPLFQESHELASQLGNRRMVAVNNKALGNWFVLSASDYGQAVPYLTRAYADLREMENQFHLATVCYDLAEAYALLGEGMAGKSYYEEGMRIAAALGNEPLQSALAALAQQCPELTLALNDRQQQAVGFMRANGAITNQEYRDLTDVSPRTAARDLNELVMAGICEQVGQGRTTHYQMAHKQSS